MEYFSLKRIIRNWDKKQSVFIYGRTLSAVHFSTEQPYTLKNFVNYKDGETGDNVEDSQPTEIEILQNENENLVDEIINLKAENLLLKMEV